MKRRLLDLKVAPRWVIQFIDTFILTFSFTLSYFVIKQFEFSEVSRGQFFIYTASYTITSFIVFYLMGIHKGLIRYSNIMDLSRIILAVFATSVIYLIAVKFMVEKFLHFHSLEGKKVLFINFFITSTFLIILRAVVKQMFQFAKRAASTNRENIIIYGADTDSILIKNGIEMVKKGTVNVLGFVVMNGYKRNNSIEQKRIFRLDDLVSLRTKHRVDKLIISKRRLGADDKKKLFEECLRLGIKVITVAPSDEWVFGELSPHQIKELKIEDVLQRDEIIIDNKVISQEITGKKILVTGAAGSIGSELVRQILTYKPSSIILCDQAESPLHELKLEIQELNSDINFKVFIGNIQNFNRMEQLFKQFRPQIVFHAAAYKHVPMMEENPSEAILTNVHGTKNIAELALLFDAEKFIMVSTDKAVNPSNIMGASKRIAEMYVQSLNNVQNQPVHDSNNVIYNVLNNSKTKFITTRFGNVLGSNGSVLPRFQSQIQKGGPVTVTHPEITRFFMTIPEAVRLVLEAASMGNGGEIYVFDMGKSVKILDLAEQMIKLAGLKPYQDVKIEFTGLRPGEKLYEELLSDDELTSPTHHEKIKIAKVCSRNYMHVLLEVEELIHLCNYDNDMNIAMKMKEIVKEFVSNNSIFEHLDIRKFGKIRHESVTPDQVLAIKKVDISDVSRKSLSA